MRKEFVLLFYLFGEALLFCIGTPPPLGWGADQPPGKITNTVGQAVVKRTNYITESSGGSAVVPIYEGDWVQAGLNSLVLLEIAGGMQAVMNETTEFLLISRWEIETGFTWILRLKKGELWIRSMGKPIRFEVETAVGTVAVSETQGLESAIGYLYGDPYGVSEGKPPRPLAENFTTEFDLRVDPDEVTTLTVLAGQVDFGSAFNTWSVSPSTVSSARRGQPCSKPQRVEVQSVLAWAERMRPLVEESTEERQRK